ncbi:MAG TPA: hypothetical protein VMA95_17065 [Streptosporangiaceae bacterium]|nr:hypothetical protein [Streptosporangiaceae bacterium]
MTGRRKAGVAKVSGDAGLGVVPGASGADPARPNAARIYDYLLGGYFL